MIITQEKICYVTLCDTILYYIISHCFTLYWIVLYCIVVYSIYHNMLYYMQLLYATLFRTVTTWKCSSIVVCRHDFSNQASISTLLFQPYNVATILRSGPGGDDLTVCITRPVYLDLQLACNFQRRLISTLEQSQRQNLATVSNMGPVENSRNWNSQEPGYIILKCII